jgi:hypothetical protein
MSARVARNARGVSPAGAAVAAVGDRPGLDVRVGLFDDPAGCWPWDSATTRGSQDEPVTGLWAKAPESRYMPEFLELLDVVLRELLRVICDSPYVRRRQHSLWQPPICGLYLHPLVNSKGCINS